MMEDGHCVATVHAEANAIIQAAKNGVAIEGATIYTTASPVLALLQADRELGRAADRLRRVLPGRADLRVRPAARHRAGRAPGPGAPRPPALRHRATPGPSRAPEGRESLAASGAGRSRSAPSTRADRVLAREEERLRRSAAGSTPRAAPAGPGRASPPSAARTSASARSTATTRIRGRRPGSLFASISAVSFSVQSGTYPAPPTSTWTTPRP